MFDYNAYPQKMIQCLSKNHWKFTTVFLYTGMQRRILT